MKRPPIRYLVSSPSGDVAVDEGRLDYPLEGDPLKTSYRDYFLAIADFLSGNDFQRLLQAITAMTGVPEELSNLNEIIVRSEKHGALSHPASVECILSGYRAKFGLHVAVTDAGKDSLQREFVTLKMLHSRFGLPYIPVPYVLHEMNSMAFLLEEWFDDYHEFHIAETGDDRRQMKLWEFGHGDRILTPAQAFDIYRQAAQILTIYYDLRNFRLIYPWHHAAGDFVVKCIHDGIDVRLTTVRGYESFVGADQNELINPLLALFYFFMHLSIQMRLDRLDGVGEIVWAEDYCVDATVAGFFEGLEKKNDFADCCGSIRSFLQLLKSFTKEELRKTAAPVAEQFERTAAHGLIQEHLRNHTDRLHLTLQNSP